MCMVIRNLNADLSTGTRLFVDRMSACSVRVVDSPVYKGPGFAYSGECVCTTSPASCSSGRSSVKDVP